MGNPVWCITEHRIRYTLIQPDMNTGWASQRIIYTGQNDPVFDTWSGTITTESYIWKSNSFVWVAMWDF